MTDFAHARRLMVDNQLRTAGVTDRRVLAAMGEVPREKFLPVSRRALAYIDEVQPISSTRKLGAPAPFARLLQLAAIRHDERVLDVGAGSGYGTAVLAHLAQHVVGVEADAALTSSAQATLSALGLPNAEVVTGPLVSAGADRGPYDVIVLEGAVPAVPDELFEQLKPDGRLVALIGGNSGVAVAHLYARAGNTLAASAAFDARLPPLMGLPTSDFVF